MDWGRGKGRQEEEKRNEKERIGRRRGTRDAEEGEFNVTRRMGQRKENNAEQRSTCDGSISGTSCLLINEVFHLGSVQRVRSYE